ncbi:hypothetical protein HK096_006492, partial [Nowakowskiella sp. JEL0078]
MSAKRPAEEFNGENSKRLRGNSKFADAPSLPSTSDLKLDATKVGCFVYLSESVANLPSFFCKQIFLEAKKRVAEKAAALSSKFPVTQRPMQVAPRPPIPRPILNLHKDEIQRKIEEAKARVKAAEMGAKFSVFGDPISGNPMRPGNVGRPPMVNQLATARPALNSTSKSYRGASMLPQPIFATVKANQRAITVPIVPVKELKLEKQSSTFADPTKNPYFDPKVTSKSSAAPKVRAPKSFRFVEPGKYIQLAHQMRNQAQLEKLKKEIAETVKKAGMDAELEL